MKLELSFPCPQNWEQMRPTAKGRFCGSCQKEVIDFTQKTDAETLRLLRKSAEMSCGRFTPQQIQPLSRDAVRKWAVAALAAAGIAFLSPGAAHAQSADEHGVVPAQEIVIVQDSVRQDSVALQEVRSITVKLMDAKSKAPLGYGIVVVKVNGVAVTGGQTDEDGKITISNLPEAEEYVLTGNYVGYKVSTVTLKSDKSEALVNIEMELEGDRNWKGIVIFDPEPLIDMNETTTGQTFRRDQIGRLPYR